MSGPEPLPEPERRQFPRLAAKADVRASCHLGTLGLGRELALRAVDLSPAGVRLAVHAALEPGRVVRVELFAPGREAPVVRFGEVVWSRELGHGCQAGILFWGRIGPAELAALCARPGDCR